jgi:pimeloyl-ACP methyl ester carboxylesterase
MRSERVLSVRVPGSRRLSVRAWDGEGAPLILLHGLLDCSEGWASVAARVDRPYADDVVAVLRALEVEGGTLVGHSLGGAVAALVAERTPRIDALALLAPAGFGRIRIAELFALPVVRDVATALLPLALANPLTVTAAYSTFVAHRRVPERDLITRLGARAMRAPKGVRAATLAIADAGREPVRPIAFGGPVAALWGARDALVPTDHAHGLRAALPQARVEIWPGMGHHPQRERPRQLTQFLAALGPGPGQASRRVA